jgi:hypothetical protein
MLNPMHRQKTAMSAVGGLKWTTQIRLIVAGEALFVGGWSLMWASSLDLVPFIPVRLCPVLMVVGLVLAAPAVRPVRLRRPTRKRDRAAPVVRPTP